MRRHVKTVHADFKDDETIDGRENPENIEAVHADFKDDETIDGRENPENIEAVHADFKDDETIDDRENPEIIDKDKASDKAGDDEAKIKDKVETDDSDIDVEEEAEEEEGKEEKSDDPWLLLIEEAFERCQSAFNELVTKHMAIEGVDEDDARKRVNDKHTSIQKSVGEHFR